MHRAIALLVMGSCGGQAADPGPAASSLDTVTERSTARPTAEPPATAGADALRPDIGHAGDGSTPVAEQAPAWIRAVLAERDPAIDAPVWLPPGEGSDLYEGPSGVPLSVTRHTKYGTTSSKPVIDTGRSVASSRPHPFGRKPGRPLPITPKGATMVRILCQEPHHIVAPWVFRTDVKQTIASPPDNHDGDWEGIVRAEHSTTLVRGQLLVSPSSAATLGVITSDAEFGCRADCSTEHALVVLRGCGRQIELRTTPAPR